MWQTGGGGGVHRPFATVNEFMRYYVNNGQTSVYVDDELVNILVNS